MVSKIARDIRLSPTGYVGIIIPIILIVVIAPLIVLTSKHILAKKRTRQNVRIGLTIWPSFKENKGNLTADLQQPITSTVAPATETVSQSEADKLRLSQPRTPQWPLRNTVQWPLKQEFV